MKILYHMPSLHSIYAQRTIYYGYKNAFENMGHEFRPLTADDDSNAVFEHFHPDIFITSSFFWHRKYLDFDRLRSYRKEGVFVLAKIDFWRSPMSRVNEAASLENDNAVLKLMREGLLADEYFHTVEQDDERMHGFQEGTGLEFHTIPLAADATLMKPNIDDRFAADISYIGTNLPGKKHFFDQCVRPLGNTHDLRLYGQDWTEIDRALGWIQRGGQLFNIPWLRSLRKPKLELEDEAKIYSSSIISINVHEDYQRQYGGDCNERTFKIPMCNGFQVVDNVACIKKYFDADSEVIVADSDDDWIEKTHYYLNNADKRNDIIKAGRKKALSHHTYHHRAQQILDIAMKRGT